MKNIIPRFIHKKFAEKSKHGRFDAVTMFMDISGFTPITEKLMTKGKEGAENLSIILNTIFIPLINVIYESGGFISAFEGDAFTIIFRKQIDAHIHYNPFTRALHTAVKIQRLFKQIGIQDVEGFGRFTLSVKVGISYGEVKWGIVGYEPDIKPAVCKTYFFRGKAIDNCAEAEHQCDKGDIVLDKSFYYKLVLTDEYAETKPYTKIIDENYYLLNIDTSSKITRHIDALMANESTVNLYKLPDISKEVALNFYSNRVLEQGQVGEFRDVVSVFVSFKEPSGFDELNELVGNVLKNVYSLGGYFEGLNFGDKGGNMLILFGAPVSYENNIERSLNFILSIRKLYENSIRAGITYGEVYSGIKGSHIRSIYGVLGDVINLSARFMMKAEWSGVWISERIARHIDFKYKVEELGAFRFKGKSKPITVFELIDSKQTSQDYVFEGKMLGRKKEFARIWNYFTTIKEGRFGGVVYVYGDAGIGKSRLLYEIAESEHDNIKTLFLQSDGILRKSMNPFIYFFNNYFKLSQAQTQDVKREIFDNIFSDLIETLDNQPTKEFEDKGENKEHIINELVRTKSLIGALLGIKWEGSLYEQLGAKARFENTLDAVKTFFKAESILNPLIILVEDLHWIDEDSLKVFEILTRNIEAFPIIIVASSRFHDDGSKPVFNLPKEVTQREVSLDELDEASIYDFIALKLGYKPNDELFRFIMDKTKGNPFYAEQFCFYLKENRLIETFIDDSLLESDDTSKSDLAPEKQAELTYYRFKSKTFDIPKNVNAIILSRLDRLTKELKEAVQISSILGNEFDIKVFFEMQDILSKLLDYLNIVIDEKFDMWALSTILESNKLKTLLSEGELERIWHSLTERKYSFNNMLLREVAYDMQPRKRLQNLHRIAGESIEKLYRGDETYYSDLAFHYEKAEINDLARKYLWKASEYASKNYKNQSAINLYDKLLKYVYNKDEEADICGRKGEILDLIGNWDEALKVLNRGIELSKQTGNHKKEAELKVIYGKILQEQSHYDSALNMLFEAMDLSKSLTDNKTLANALINIGEIYRLKGKYDEALKHLKRSLIIYAEIGDKKGTSDSLDYIGNIYRHKNNYDKALVCHFKTIEIKEAIGDKDGISLAYNNIAIIYWNKGENEKSMEYLQKSLEIKEKLGNKRGKCISLNGLGILYKDKGEYEKALKCQTESMRVNKEVGDKRGVSMCTDGIGIIHTIQGNYNEAVKHFKKSLDIKRQIGAESDLGHTYSYLSYAYLKIGNYNQALRIALEHLRNIKTVGSDFEHGRTHLVMAMILAYAGDDFLKEEQSIKLIKEASSLTSLMGNPEAYFEYSLNKSLSSNFLNTLVPTLYEYGKYLYNNKLTEQGLDYIKKAKAKASSSNMRGEIENIKKLCEEINFNYDFI